MDSHVFSDQDIQALVDNELDWENEKKIRQRLADDPQAQERFEILRQQKRLLQTWWRGKKSH